MRCAAVQAATLYAACFVVGAGMEAFMVKTGFYAVATRKEAGMGIPKHTCAHACTHTAANASARARTHNRAIGQRPIVSVQGQGCGHLPRLWMFLHREILACRGQKHAAGAPTAQVFPDCCVPWHRETGVGKVGEGGGSAPQGRSRQIAA